MFQILLKMIKIYWGLSTRQLMPLTLENLNYLPNNFLINVKSIRISHKHSNWYQEENLKKCVCCFHGTIITRMNQWDKVETDYIKENLINILKSLSCCCFVWKSDDIPFLKGAYHMPVSAIYDRSITRLLLWFDTKATTALLNCHISRVLRWCQTMNPGFA